MKSDILQYADFAKAIQTDELVYLFGTGMSAALTGMPYGWRKWIEDGIGALQDTALGCTLKKELDTDPSTENMISVVGKLLRAAKEEGVYADWMHRSFEVNPIRDLSLAETLRKLLLVQDVFATTNYDLLLEDATGLGTCSYEQPDTAFMMLKEGLSTHVLHIHGIYDSTRGIDSIVADREQYDRVLNDQGAQFIQNLLGTRTLILVGCGKTTEDANIARFLSFAKDWLKLDRPGYFLYNGAGDPGEMPENIVPIPYGDDYGDLPLFLEDMAQLRLQARIGSSPMIARTAYTGRQNDAFGLSEYHFAREYLKFCGRKRELAQLSDFAGCDKPVAWWAVTGQGGAGKSRLAYEFIRRGKANCFCCFVNPDAREEDIRSFRPFNNTFLIFDYIRGNERHIASMVTWLMDRFVGFPYNLRMLFLERDNQTLTGSWYQLLESAIDISHRGTFRGCEYNAAIAARGHQFLYLDDLDEEAVEELVGEICKKKGLPEDPHRDRELKEAYRKKLEQLRFRPLFLQLFVEAWIDNGSVQIDYENAQQLLEAVLLREQERILNSVGGDVSVCSALIRLLIRAGVSDTLATDELPELYREDWALIQEHNRAHALPGIQRAERLTSLLGDAEQALRPDRVVIEPMYPDIIKEAMFLYYTDDADAPAVWAELWETCPAKFAAFLSRAVTDFPANEPLREQIRDASAGNKNPYAMEARHAILWNEVVRSVEEGPALLQIAEEEFTYWKNAPQGTEQPEALRLIILKGLDFSTKQLIGWSQQAAYDALEQLAAFPPGEQTTPYQIDALLEYAHYFVEKAAGASSSTIALTEPLIEVLPESREKTLFWLRLQRERAVRSIQQGNSEGAWEIYGEVCARADMSDEQMSELYSYFCFSCCRECRSMLMFGEATDFYFELQDMAVAYASREEPIAFNDKIHYYYLHAKLLHMETLTLATTQRGMADYGLHHLDGLISEIEGNEMIADFSGLLVGAWRLKVGYDNDVTDDQTETYLQRADKLLEQYPNNCLLAGKLLGLWETAWTMQFRKTVPAAYVDRAYAILLRYPKDAEVQDRFHALLTASERVSAWKQYYSRQEIIAGLIENHQDEFIIPPALDDSISQHPFVRLHPKVGANDPCPCGSGKKFKKCCRGKEIYD